MKLYHTVVVQYERGEPWQIAYGSFIKSNCIAKIEDSYQDVYKTKIIKTSAEQSAIDYAVMRLNRGV